MKEVVVTGLGFITCIGNDKETVLDSLKNLKSGIDKYEGFDDPKIPVHVLGDLKEFNANSVDAEDWEYPSKYKISRSILRGFSPNALFGYCSSIQAIEDAGLTLEDVSNEDTGLYTASAGSSGLLTDNISRMHKFGVEKTNPKGIIACVAGTLSFNLVSLLKIKGSSCGFVSACASSGHALGMAFDEIQSGKQSRMVVVGAEDCTVDCVLPFGSMRALSPNPDPKTASRPFDKDRDGFVGTGGGVTFILEDKEVALARGAKIYCEMAGWGKTSDGFNPVLPDPVGGGLLRAIKQALKYSNLTAGDVDYVNAHAPSTPAGDMAEILALREVFKDVDCPAISSTKSITGHGLSLASILEAGLSILSMENGFCPGSANIENLEPEAESLNIIRESLESNPKVILSNSSGFGGANVCLAFKK